MHPLDCPRCGASLVGRSFEGAGAVVAVDLCEQGCGGVWLDESDMRHGRELIEPLAGVPSARDASVNRSVPVACPICRSTMRRFRWNYTSAIVLDQCPEGHGTWLDGGEAGEMRAAEEHEALAPGDQARLRARLEMARLEVLTRARRADYSGRLPHPAVVMLENVWTRFL